MARIGGNFLYMDNLDGKIVSVTAIKTENGKYIDTLIISYKRPDGTPEWGDFVSPMLGADNIRMWRRLMLRAILGRTAINDPVVVNVFKDYKAAIYKKDIKVATDDGFIDILAIGKDAENMIYPSAYGLWSVESDDEEFYFEDGNDNNE
jgi:hypothetical protein